MSDTTQGQDAAPAAAPAAPSQADILAFDPFGPPTSSPSTGEGAQPTPPADGTTGGAPANKEPAQPDPGAAAAPDTGAPQTPATPAGPAQAPNLEQLFQQQTDAIREAVHRPEAAAPTEPPQPKFNLAIPPQVLTAMRSEDPNEFGTAMHAIVNGIANHLWQTFTQHQEQTVQPQINDIVASQVQAMQVRAQVAQDFYGAHKTLSAPQLAPIVQQAGVTVAQRRAAERKPLNWSPELRDEIAEEVYKVFPQLKPQEEPAKPPAGQPPAKPRYQPGNGARPGGTGAPEQEPAFGTDLLG